MKHDDVQKKTEAELKNLITSLKEEKFQLRIKKTLGQLKQMSELRRVKREHARLLTEQTRRARETLSSRSKG